YGETRETNLKRGGGHETQFCPPVRSSELRDRRNCYPKWRFRPDDLANHDNLGITSDDADRRYLQSGSGQLRRQRLRQQIANLALTGDATNAETLRGNLIGCLLRAQQLRAHLRPPFACVTTT